MDSDSITPIQSAPSTSPGTVRDPMFGFRYKTRRYSNENGYDRFTQEECGEDEPIFQRPSVISVSKKVAAEFLGTFILTFAAAGTTIVNEETEGKLSLLGLGAGSGLAVTIIILSMGHISGAHVNPSVSIAFATFRHFPWTQVPLYIVAQVLGSISGAFALKATFQPFMGGGVTVPSCSYGHAFSIEFIITFILMFVVAAVATDARAVGEMAGVAVGATVILNTLIAGSKTGASMNPVRSLGPAIAAGNYKAIWVYIVAPITGALVGAAAYTVVRKFDSDDDVRDEEIKQTLFRK